MTLAAHYIDEEEPVAEASPWPERIAFICAVCIVLTFSQFWQMPLIGPDGDAEKSAIFRNLFFPAYGAGLVMAFARPWAVLKTALRGPLIWLLIADCFLSMVWSIDPSTTERRCIALLFTTICAMVLASRFEWPKLLEVFATSFAVVVFCCYFLALAVPSYGKMTSIFPGAWRGVYQDKNALGDLMTIGTITFVASAILNAKRRWLWAGFAVLAVGLIIFSTSKTSLVTLVIGSACLAFVWLAKRGPAVSVAATFIAVTGIVVLGCAIVFVPDAFFALLGKDATFTGRTIIWAAVQRLINDRPWIGYGYASVWTDESGRGPLSWIIKWAHFRPHHAHNSWMETWLAMGIPGLILWGAVFIETWMKAIYAVYTKIGGYFALPFLAVYSLTTMTESVAFIYNDFYWVIFAAMAFRLGLPERSAELEEAEELDDFALTPARP